VGKTVYGLIAWARALLPRDQRGQGLAEYALILALIAVIAIAALVFLGTRISSILSTIGVRI
jgi:pilus assembly protein Flp/PilA